MKGRDGLLLPCFIMTSSASISQQLWRIFPNCWLRLFLNAAHCDGNQHVPAILAGTESHSVGPAIAPAVPSFYSLAVRRLISRRKKDKGAA